MGASYRRWIETWWVLWRSVEDIAVMLDALAGFDSADPTTARSIGRVPASYLEVLNPEGLRGLRIGVFRSYLEAAPRSFQTIINSAIEELRDAGAEIVEDFAVQPQPDYGAVSTRVLNIT